MEAGVEEDEVVELVELPEDEERTLCFFFKSENVVEGTLRRTVEIRFSSFSSSSSSRSSSNVD